MVQFPYYRPRRLRQSEWMRDLMRETTLGTQDLIWPIFVREGEEISEPIATLPGVNRLSIDQAVLAAQEARDLGIPVIALFPYVARTSRTSDAQEAFSSNNLVNRATKAIKDAVPDIGIMLDVALDPYTDHGHDGILIDGEIDNDRTLEVLVKQALAAAAAGADILGPSDMMDGRIGMIREALEDEGFKKTAIMAYSAKFASSFYGPFRDATGASGVLQGDKKTYQLDYANLNEALNMVQRDISEGADMVMVKPGMPYLDICAHVAREISVPLFAYQVSGEYAMLKLGAQSGIFDEEKIVLETLMGFKRAGCTGILTYFAPFVARILNERR